MYRLVRRFRARVKTQEIIIFGITLSFAVIFGCGAGKWYNDTGRESWLVASVNIAGGDNDAVYATGGVPGDIESQTAGAQPTAQNDDFSGGFFSSPKAGTLPPANGYSASHLALLGDVSASDTDIAVTDGAGEPNNPEDDLYLHPDAGGAENAGDEAADFPPGAGHDADEAAAKPSDSVSDQPVYTVKVIYNGDRQVIKTVGKKVSDLFVEYGIILSPDDIMTGAYLDGFIDSDLYIEIKRVTQKTVTEEIRIPAKIVYRDNAEITDGQSKVVRQGSDGLKRVEYVITYENGIQTGKDAVKEEIIKEAVSSIVEQGSSGTRIGKNGVEFTYSKVIDVKCTAYTSSYEDTGKRPGDPAFGITKSGTVARKGIVAVDPSVIPLGTKMYIEILDDTIEDYGIAIAEDTGGKIKGKKVDLYFDATREELKEFGVRKAKVYIID